MVLLPYVWWVNMLSLVLDLLLGISARNIKNKSIQKESVLILCFGLFRKAKKSNKSFEDGGLQVKGHCDLQKAIVGDHMKDFGRWGLSLRLLIAFLFYVFSP